MAKKKNTNRMCITIFIQNYKNYKLVLINNRDEFISRKTSSLTFHSNIHSSIDERDGTWLGINSSGNYSFITNHRHLPSLYDDSMKSRGELVLNYLKFNSNPVDYIDSINPSHYNPFNLIVGTPTDSYYISKTPTDSIKFTLSPSTIYGISNGVLSNAYPNTTEWDKVSRGKQLFKNVLENTNDKTSLIDGLLNVLTDVFENNVPLNMFDYDLERKLTSIFVDVERFNGEYGTRTHSIILIDQDDLVTYVEVNKYPESRIVHEFKISK